METILIAIDFSKAAKNATRYGFELAKTIQAKVILFSAFQIPLTRPDSFGYYTPDYIEQRVLKQLADEAEALDPQRTVALETKCRRGSVADAILDVAQANNVSTIVIGMKGHGKEIRKYFGSTVTHLSKQSTIPLIVVPEEAVYMEPKTIAFASDITYDTDLHTLVPLKRIAKSFNAKLYIVRVIKNFMYEEMEKYLLQSKVNWFFSDLLPEYAFPKNENVGKALNTFVKEHSVDMLAVIPHKHDFIDKLFNRSVTKDMIFHTHVPLLVLPAPAQVLEEADSSSHLYAIH